MDKKNLKKTLITKKTKDYTYGIIFFLTFSFFVFFVIRPNLVNVFSLQEELGKLRLLDTGYENVIKKIITIQTFLETNRSDLYLLDEAISSSPQINKIVYDIQASASDSGIIVHQIDINKVDLKEKGERTEKNILLVSMATRTSFAEANTFVSSLMSQRRLKNMKHITIDRDTKYGTESATLDIKIEIEGFYL